MENKNTPGASPLEIAAKTVATGGALKPEDQAHMLGTILGRNINKNADPVQVEMGKKFLKEHPEMTDTLLDSAAAAQSTDPDEIEMKK